MTTTATPPARPRFSACDNTPLAPLLLATCPLYGVWVTLVAVASNWPLTFSGILSKNGVDDKQFLGGPEAQAIADPVERDKYVQRARLLACRLLGKLAGFVVQPVPGLDYTKDALPPLEMFVSKIMMPIYSEGAPAAAWRRASMREGRARMLHSRRVQRQLKELISIFRGRISLFGPLV